MTSQRNNREIEITLHLDMATANYFMSTMVPILIGSKQENEDLAHEYERAFNEATKEEKEDEIS